MSNILHERARIAALTRSRKPDDPELVEARRNLRALRLEELVTHVVDGWSELSDESRARLTEMLNGAA